MTQASDTTTDGADALSAAASLAKSSKLAVFDTQLASLWLQAGAGGAEASVDTLRTEALSPRGELIQLAGDTRGLIRTIGGTEYVIVDIVAKDGDGAALLPTLQQAGLQFASSFRGVVSGAISQDHLEDLRLALWTGDRGYASVSLMGTRAGVVTSQVDAAAAAPAARSSFGVDGSGVTVGVLSDSFDTDRFATTHMAEDIANGELPAATQILQDSSGGTDEGRALAQVIHDIAPGAAIIFATAEFGQANMANNILALASAGAKVIVDDSFYYSELYYQDGPIAQAIDQVVAKGVVYFSAGGNDHNGSKVTGYQGAWSAGGSFRGSTAMSFAPGQDYIPVTISGGGEGIVLQWDNPGSSAGGAGATADLDLYLTNQSGSTVYRSSLNGNIGRDPSELLNTSGLSAGTYYVRVGLNGGAAPGEIKLLALGNGLDIYFDSPASNTNPGTLYGHPAAAGAIAVGSAAFNETPAFGVSPPIPEYYTSEGPTRVLFDTAGARLATPSVRDEALVAPDGGNTSFFGHDDATDSDVLPNFSGASAAAPAAAAVAALVLQANPSLTPAQVRTILQSTAIDMLSPGFDSRTGYGLVDAAAAVAAAKGQSQAPSPTPAITGTAAGDVLSGTAGNDIINGLGGDDVLQGLGGDDRLDGGAGRDRLEGGPGADTFVFGALGDTAPGSWDFIAEWSAGDRIDLSAIDADTAAAGRQAFHFGATSGHTGDIVASYDAAADATRVDLYVNGDADPDARLYVNGNVALSAADFAVSASSTPTPTPSPTPAPTPTPSPTPSPPPTPATTITGTSGADVLTGSSADEAINGLGGDDVLQGLGGSDLLNGGAGRDRLEGGAGNDIFLFSAAGDTSAGAWDYIADWNAGDRIDLSAISSGFHLGATSGRSGDIVIAFEAAKQATRVELYTDGDATADAVFYVGGNVSLTASDFVLSTGPTPTPAPTPAPTPTPTTPGITGTAGNDVLSGTSGDDVMSGLGGDDILQGLAGADRLDGGSGRDRLEGGPGADTYAFGALADTPLSAWDFIADWSAGDMIDLSAIDADSAAAGDQAFHLGATSGHAGDVVIAYDSQAQATRIDLYADADAAPDARFYINGDHAAELTAAVFVL